MGLLNFFRHTPEATSNRGKARHLDQDVELRLKNFMGICASYTKENCQILKELREILSHNSHLLLTSGDTYHKLAAQVHCALEHGEAWHKSFTDVCTNLPVTTSEQEFSTIQQNLVSRIELLSSSALELNQEIKAFRTALSWMS